MNPTPLGALLCFALTSAYCFWLINWRCRPGTPYTDVDGIIWNRRARFLVAASLALVMLAAVNWVLTCHQ